MAGSFPDDVEGHGFLTVLLHQVDQARLVAQRLAYHRQQDVIDLELGLVGRTLSDHFGGDQALVSRNLEVDPQGRLDLGDGNTDPELRWRGLYGPERDINLRLGLKRLLLAMMQQDEIERLVPGRLERLLQVLRLAQLSIAQDQEDVVLADTRLRSRPFRSD